MNAFLSDQRTVVAVGIGVLLVTGVAGVGVLGAQASWSTSRAPTVDGPPGVQSEGNESGATVTPNQTIEAMNAAENETNGTVVGAQLAGRGNGGLEQSTFVYELDVLTGNGTQLLAEVYAENATVIGVESANESDGVLGDLFGSDDELPDDARNLSSLRPATEAVRLAVNETGADRANRTVTEVSLGSRNDTRVYTVTLLEQNGDQREVVVAADEGEGGVVTTDPQNGMG